MLKPTDYNTVTNVDSISVWDTLQHSDKIDRNVRVLSNDPKQLKTYCCKFCVWQVMIEDWILMVASESV